MMGCLDGSFAISFDWLVCLVQCKLARLAGQVTFGSVYLKSSPELHCKF